MFLKNLKSTTGAQTLQHFLHILLALFIFYFTWFTKSYYILQTSADKTVFNNHVIIAVKIIIVIQCIF